MTNMIVTVLQILFVLWLLERIIGKSLITPALQFLKMSAQGMAWTITVAVFAAVGLSSLLCRMIPPAVQWLRSVRR